MMLIHFCVGLYGLRSEVLTLMPIAAFTSMSKGYESFLEGGRLDTEYMAVSGASTLPHGVAHALPLNHCHPRLRGPPALLGSPAQPEPAAPSVV